MDRRDFLQYSFLTAVSLFGADHWPCAATGTPPDVTGLSGRIVLPGQADYDTVRRDRNPRLSATPALIVFCRNAEDIAQAMAWAKTHNTPFRVRAGGHSYEGYSLVDDGIVADVSGLREIHLDTAHRTVRVGAGFMLGEIIEALGLRGLALPTGSCPTVGVAGSTLGGGYGLLSRSLGLTCDSLLDVEIVTADGKQIHANTRTHPDLFWACRGGGGGNFGVATAFTFRVHPVKRVAICRLAWDWKDLEPVLAAWQGWAVTTDEKLTSVLKLPSQANGTVSCAGVFLGIASALSGLIRPLRRAGTLRSVSIEEVDYREAARIFGGSRGITQIRYKNSSDYADRPLHKEAVSVLSHFLQTAPGANNLVQLEAYGGAISHLAANATAFPHRAGTLFNLQYQAYWKLPSAGPANMDWIKQFRQAMQPYVSGRAYSNYCDAGITDWPQAYYGPNLARLMQVKAKYDPDNFFNFPQSIPLPKGQS